MYANVGERIVHVVDDDESVRRALGRLLTSAGYEPVCYASAEAVLEAAGCEPLRGCLVADIRMDGMNGLTLAATLRDRGANLPVIIVTAHDTQEMRAEADRAGATAFLRKPVTDQALLGAIVSAMEPGHGIGCDRETGRAGSGTP